MPSPKAEVEHNVVPALLELLVPIAELVPDPEPHKKHGRDQVDRLKEAFMRWGQDLPLIVQEDGMIVRVGNGRLQAAQELGWTHVAAIVLDRAAAEMAARGIFDNRIADLGQMQDDVLVKLLPSLVADDIPTGYSGDEVEALLRSAGQEETGRGEDPGAQPPVVERGTKIGTLWTLGPHRLLCGDSTIDDHVRLAAAGKPTRMAFTDPPYNVDYGASKGHPTWRLRTMANDSLPRAQWETFARAIAARLQTHVLGDCYVWCASGPEGMRLGVWFDEAGFHWSATIAWAKDRLVLSPAKYQRIYEPCLYGWFGKRSSFRGGRRQTELWHVTRPASSEAHPTMKPVELGARAIRNSSKRGDRVLDLFSGSGSTLIACEQHARTFIGLEIDPGYVESAVRRWEMLTGETASSEDVDL